MGRPRPELSGLAWQTGPCRELRELIGEKGALQSLDWVYGVRLLGANWKFARREIGKDEKVGEWRCYFRNRLLKAIGRYPNGRMTREWREHDVNGKVVKTTRHKR